MSSLAMLVHSFEFVVIRKPRAIVSPRFTDYDLTTLVVKFFLRNIDSCLKKRLGSAFVHAGYIS